MHPAATHRAFAQVRPTRRLDLSGLDLRRACGPVAGEAQVLEGGFEKFEMRVQPGGGGEGMTSANILITRQLVAKLDLLG